MSKSKPAKLRAEKTAAPASQAAQPAPAAQTSRTVRETVESVVIAFVLAFLFRTFEAEAFVIPTGSMAPTLQGRHKDLTCDNCGYRIRANASNEVNEDGSRIGNVVGVTCANCRHSMSVNPDRVENAQKYPSYNGDRIIVAKFPYEFVDPKRWDIVVFKFPGDAKTNYIKRLIGLPEETVHIEHGDILTRKKDGALQMERKPPEKQRAMAQVVYDNDYVVDEMTKKGWPLRWQNWPPNANRAWISDDGGRSFTTDGKSTGEAWLRYQHFAPSPEDWEMLNAGPLPSNYQVLPDLVTDFYAYDQSKVRMYNGRDPSPPHQKNWVGDLLLECTVDVFDAPETSKSIYLDLVEGGKHFRASIDVSTGKATLSIDGVPDYHPTAETSIRGKGTYHLAFANFDDQLTLWVNNSPVSFGPSNATEYSPLNNNHPQSSKTDPGDLAPAGIGADAGLPITVSHLRLLRDIYYIADMAGPSDQDQSIEFPLAKDQFFVLGDNSPASKDGRLWDDARTGEYYVARELMIGKALFIYWPHGLYEVPGTSIPFPGGMFPNVRDMGFVR